MGKGAGCGASNPSTVAPAEVVKAPVKSTASDVPVEVRTHSHKWGRGSSSLCFAVALRVSNGLDLSHRPTLVQASNGCEAAIITYSYLKKIHLKATAQLAHFVGGGQVSVLVI
jgi:hypothetical protein